MKRFLKVTLAAVRESHFQNKFLKKINVGNAFSDEKDASTDDPDEL